MFRYGATRCSRTPGTTSPASTTRRRGRCTSTSTACSTTARWSARSPRRSRTRPPNVDDRPASRRRLQLRRADRRRPHLQPGADAGRDPGRHEHAARHGAVRRHDAADGRDHRTAPTAPGQRHRQRHRGRRATTSASPACSSSSTASPLGSRTRPRPYALAWDTRTVANGAHTLTAGRATPRATRRCRRRSPSTSPTPTPSRTRSSRPASTCRRRSKFLPDGRMLVVELQGTIKVLPPPYTHAGPDAVPAAHQHRLGRRAAGDLRHRARPELRDQPLLLRLLHAGHAEPRPPLAVHRQRHAHRDGRRQRARPLPGSAGRQRRAPRRRDHLRQRRQAVLHDRRALRRRRRAGPHQPARQDPPHQPGRHRPDRQPVLRRRRPELSTRSGRSGCATRTAPTTTRRPAGCSSATSAATTTRPRRRRSTSARAAPTTAGRTRGHRARRRARARSTPTRTTAATRPSPAASSTTARQFPSGYQGSYFFADYTQNWIKRLDARRQRQRHRRLQLRAADGSVDGPYGDIVYLTEGPDGALYYVDLGYSDISGTFGVSKIRRISYVAANQAPIAVAVGRPDRPGRRR